MRSASRSPHPRHLLAGLASAGLVLAAHGWLLSGLQMAPPASSARADAPLRSVQVRQIVVAPPAPSAAPAPVSVGAWAAPAAAVPVRTAPLQRPRLPSRPVGGADPPPPAADTEPEVEAPPQPAEAPVYATRLPPPASLHYSLRRGAASGQAVLLWAPDGDSYALSLHGRLAAAPYLGLESRGSIDAHGIAPDRYTESRRGRELRAVNFRRDSGRITFSGPQREYGLPPGAQDRLSWMLQLGAVVAADAGLATTGREVLLFIAGSRGDAEVWSFAVQGREAIELPDAGPVETLLLRREPPRPYDTLAEVWLDPARHHLPVRVQLTHRADSTVFELQRLSLP